VESDRFPKATFEGNYAEAFDISANGQNRLTVKGKLSMHGVTREIELPASVTVKDGAISGKAEFQVVPEDFQIKIPGLVRDKISQKIDIFIAFDLKKQ
jgi:polyisoprenoid-binding protein YceI